MSDYKVYKRNNKYYTDWHIKKYDWFFNKTHRIKFIGVLGSIKVNVNDITRVKNFEKEEFKLIGNLIP